MSMSGGKHPKPSAGTCAQLAKAKVSGEDPSKKGILQHAIVCGPHLIEGDGTEGRF